MSVIIKDGWFVPANDTLCFDVVIQEVNDVEKILPYVKTFKTAIQAGANIGVWAKRLASHFEKVYTFEPERNNFEALVKNIGGVASIEIMMAGLSDKKGRAAIDVIDPRNIGAHQLKDGNDIDTVTIDSLNLKDVGLIQLDIEGCEHQALLGGVKTILRDAPVICLELKGIGKRYGYSDDDTFRLMKNLGYAEQARFHRDVLFTKVN